MLLIQRHFSFVSPFRLMHVTGLLARELVRLLFIMPSGFDCFVRRSTDAARGREYLGFGSSDPRHAASTYPVEPDTSFSCGSVIPCFPIYSFGRGDTGVATYTNLIESNGCLPSCGTFFPQFENASCVWAIINFIIRTTH